MLRDIEAQEQYLQRESNSKAKQDRSERLAALKRDVLRIKEREHLEGVHRCETRHINAQDYIREIVLRIEDCAIKNSPKKDRESIYGEGVLQFTIDGWGTLVDSSITKSSANPLIDAHMLKLVQASAPFGDVPGYVLNGGYKLVRITSDFEFKNTGNSRPSRRPRERCHFKENAK
ncbi:TonB C-terminal domain-containing protein [Pseudorhodoferax sp.]|uniref:TonB C-terminal domain-containing protein n=1 Tax=Pseudorhodoferax sp. TaxID=1993553 RepID=UPI002DD688F2|nr:TonB C-terminal domain-containing protein [Pseudorhodoferax sp.]